MHFLLSFIAFMGTCCALVFLPQATLAQLPARFGPRPMPVRGAGELVAMSPGLLKVNTQDGEWLLKVEAPPDKIALQGEALVRWLRPGMYVRFSAMLNKKGVAQSPIDELFIFTPSPQFGIGIFPESPELFEEQEAADSARKRRRTKVEGRYLIAGRLVAFRNGAMRIAAGQNVQGELAQNAKIRVDILGDYTLARPGDKVEFLGHFYEKGKAIVQNVTFTAATPFGSELEEPDNRKSSRDKQKKGARIKHDQGDEGRNAEQKDEGQRAKDEISDDQAASP